MQNTSPVSVVRRDIDIFCLYHKQIILAIRVTPTYIFNLICYGQTTFVFMLLEILITFRGRTPNFRLKLSNVQRVWTFRIIVPAKNPKRTGWPAFKG